MEKQKISKRGLLVKASEEGIMKEVKYVLIGIIIGISFKLSFLAVVGVMVGSIFSKAVKLKFFDEGVL